MFPSATPSSSYAIVDRVDKATSEFLIAPDWTVNISICDAINSQRWLPKEVVKAVKKRLQLKNPKIQLLALTLLETMVKNCGHGVHHQIVDRNILQEMTKIVKKKASFPFKDMNVREKVLVLLSSWKEAFSYGGRLPQYYWAYEELRRSGVQFPSSSSDTEVLLAPSLPHKTPRHSEAGYGTRCNENIASTTENLSFSTMNSMWNILGLLSDMLQAVNQNDPQDVKDEIMVDLVEQCRANQKKLMQLLTTTEDEELLGQGIELNDALQRALTKHDAIASGSPLLTEVTKLTAKTQGSRSKAVENIQERQKSADIPTSSLVPVTNDLIAEEEEEEDDFEHLIRRRSKNTTTYTESISGRTSEDVLSPNKSSASATAAPQSNELILVTDPPPPTTVAKSTNNQDMIDILSLTLTTAATSPQIPNNPTSSTESVIEQAPLPPTRQEHPNYFPTSYPVNTPDNYVVPWAHPKPQFPQQHQHQFPSGFQNSPLAATGGNYCNNNTISCNAPVEGTRQLNVFPTNRDARISPSPVTTSAGHKPYVPPYRLFEDLNALGGVHERFQTSLSGMSGQSIVGGRK